MSPFSFENIAPGSNLEPLNAAATQSVDRRAREESFQSHFQQSQPAERSSQAERADAPPDHTPDAEVTGASEEHQTDSDSDAGAEDEVARETAPNEDDEQQSEESQAADPAVVTVPDEVLVDATEFATADEASIDEDGVESDPEVAVVVDETVDTLQVSQQLVALSDESLKETDEQNPERVETSESREEASRTPTEVVIPNEANAEALSESESSQLAGNVAAQQEEGQKNSEPKTVKRRGNDQADRQINPLQVVAASDEQATSDTHANGADASRHRRSRDDGPGLQLADGAGPANGEQAEATPQGRFAQHLMTRSQGESSKTLELNSAQQARFVDRVARAFRAAESRGGTIRLRLHPPELGSLRLEVRVQGGALTARIEADTPLARNVLLDSLPVLRERLAEQGVRIEQFDVDLLDRQPGGLPDGPEQREQHQDDNTSTQQTTTEERDDTTGDEPTGPRWRSQNEQLDVTI